MAELNMNMIIITVIIGIISQTLAENPECGSFNKADECMQKLLLYGDPKFKFPENRDEMNAFCSNIIKYEKCTKDYSQKCLDTLARQVTSLISYGVTKTNKGYCYNQRRKDSFIAFGLCNNRVKSMCDKCMRDYIDSLLGTENHSDSKIKIPLICCNFYVFKECSLNHVSKATPHHCSEQNYNEIERVIDGYAKDTINLICGDYTEDSDKCQKVVPQTPPKLSSQKTPKSLLPSFVTILSSL